MMSDLRSLVDNKDALLLAEMAAWLHDMGKCSDEFLRKENRREVKHNKDKIEPYKSIINDLNNYELGNFKKRREDEINHNKALNKILKKEVVNKFNYDLIVNLFGNPYSLAEIIYFGRPIFIGPAKSILKNKPPEPITYLGRCHAAAHIEKEAEEGDESNCSSTLFGNEDIIYKDLSNKLNSLQYDNLSAVSENREIFLEELEKVFRNAPGETRIPINEVDLWDWSSIVAALYKSALAGALLGNKLEPNDLKWRLLAIRFDSEKVWGNASKIPVLLARKKWLTDGLDNVRKLLEEEYPLGNEVYRDENGSIFVVPDILDLLEIRDSQENKTLAELISEKLGYGGEVVVSPALSDNWWGQDPEYVKKSKEKRLKDVKDEIPPIGKILSDEEPYSPPDPKAVRNWWDDAKDNPEICTISWIRPQGPTEKGFQRKASDYWADRVTGRAKEWLGKLDKTIWIDEVADSNGRICLIAGKLGIEDWLSPDGPIKTLLVKLPNGKLDSDCQKNPSFARIRRIWETTKTFWEDVEQDFQKTVSLIGSRLKIIGNFKQENSDASPNNAYEAELKGIKFSIFYTDNNQYIIIENLQRLAQKMGASSEELKTYNNSIEYIKNHLDGKILNIYHSESKNRERPIGQLTISRVEPELTSFIPAITILSEPCTFMAIIPANRALELAKNIKKKYEKEMGKVRNRLPLTIGMVFAGSHTPLATLMDAGRRMLRISNKEEDWTLNGDAEDCSMDCILNFENGKTWRIPVKMGDGTTDDVWYPYFYVNGTPDNRSTAFQGPKGWLVHVKELKKGDEIKIAPSRFDFEFLDTASRRFEVGYENGKRWDSMKFERPYLLEELDHFETLWAILSKRLARSQIKNVIGLIETKREEWLLEEGNDVFEKFVHDVLHNANWKDGIPSNIEELEKDAVSGKLRDIVELYIDILRMRDLEEKEREECK